jgi:hypothetical protein
MLMMKEQMYNIYIDYFKPKEPCFVKPITLEEAKRRIATLETEEGKELMQLYPKLKEYYYIDKYDKPPKGY